MATRDPEIIKRDIQIADLSASNCALQANLQMVNIDLAQMRIDVSKQHHDRHVANKAAFEAELAAALAEAEKPGASGGRLDGMM